MELGVWCCFGSATGTAPSPAWAAVCLVSCSPRKTSERISEQEVVFESSLSHLQIPNSFNVSVVLGLFYVIKGTWSNLAIEHLLAARQEKVPARFSGPCRAASCFALARLNPFIFSSHHLKLWGFIMMGLICEVKINQDSSSQVQVKV